MTGLEEMETYISRCHNTVVQYIVMRPILDIFLEEERRTGLRVPKRWWEQEGLYFAGLCEARMGGGGGGGKGLRSRKTR